MKMIERCEKCQMDKRGCHCTSPHPNYGGCDAFGPNGSCSECTGLLERQDGMVIPLRGGMLEQVGNSPSYIKLADAALLVVAMLKPIDALKVNIALRSLLTVNVNDQMIERAYAAWKNYNPPNEEWRTREAIRHMLTAIFSPPKDEFWEDKKRELNDFLTKKYPAYDFDWSGRHD